MESKRENFSERIRQYKVFLINTLREEADFFLQLVHQDKLITDREYFNLKDGQREKIVINLLDKLRDKGEESCRKFTKLLRQEIILETFPKLKNHPIIGADNPVQDTSKLSIDLQQKHHRICRELSSINMAQLKFLCMDLVCKNHSEAKSDAEDLFVQLEEQELFDDVLFLPELLYRIGRLDLLVILGTSREEVDKHLQACRDTTKGVSAYRCMLYGLSVSITEETLHQVRFLWSKCSKTQLGPSASLLDIMIEMEKQQRLGEDNLDELHNILDKCDKQLSSRINKWKNRHKDQEQVLRNPAHEVADPEFFRNTLAEGEYYPMTQRPLGYCLIINNNNFHTMGMLPNRRGTDEDRDNLTRVFGKMHFLVEVRNDLQAKDMINVIKAFAQKNHSAMDVFVCCVLSHGEKGTVLGVDGIQVEIRDLTLPFAKCRTLASKPKLFFIQACQVIGLNLDKGITFNEICEEDAHMVVQHSIPLEADFIICMATVHSFPCYRNVINRSIYIQELCIQLEKCCPRKEDILSILTKMNREIRKQVWTDYKQIPEPQCTLTKKLVFPMD